MNRLVTLLILASCLAVPLAQASYVDIDLAGWQSSNDLGGPDNGSASVDIGPGSQVTGFDYLDLQFESFAPSYQVEFALYVSNSDASGNLNWAPSVEPSAGVFGPASGSWGGPSGYAPYYGAAPFATLGDGLVIAKAFQLYDDPGLDAIINAGILRIFYEVPEPATVALLAVSSLAFLRRRR